jgi:phage shock protein A
MSKLNKKLALLKQQHQQFKLKLQSVKEEAAQKSASEKLNSPSLQGRVGSLSAQISSGRNGELRQAFTLLL